MTQVSDIWDEAKKIVGNSSDAVMFRRITDAVEILNGKGDFDAFLGTLDIRASDRLVTLPNEVETVLAVNICGRPALARDEVYQYHQNGPGSCGQAIRWEWVNLAQSSTFRPLSQPGQLIAYCEANEDENAEVWVYGLDARGDQIRTRLPNGTYRDGWKVPVFKGPGTVGENAPFFARITSVRKSVTSGPVRLTTVGGAEEILLGVYQANETLPQFRQIRLSHPSEWVRVHFRRRSVEVRSRYDLIPVEPRQAILMAMRALKFYDEPGGFAQGEAFEATAVRWMSERQHVLAPAVAHPLQVIDGAADALSDRFDNLE